MKIKIHNYLTRDLVGGAQRAPSEKEGWEGWLAFGRGNHYTANPYPQGSKSWKLWDKAYHEHQKWAQQLKEAMQPNTSGEMIRRELRR